MFVLLRIGVPLAMTHTVVDTRAAEDETVPRPATGLRNHSRLVICPHILHSGRPYEDYPPPPPRDYRGAPPPSRFAKLGVLLGDLSDFCSAEDDIRLLRTDTASRPLQHTTATSPHATLLLPLTGNISFSLCLISLNHA